MTNRYVCIHGHFYQPPRENPWLEAIEVQDSAYPYHDWNERITVECYAPNSLARTLDEKGRIVELVNNYGRMSFNFGPTLLSWLETYAPDVYQRILVADKESQTRFGGHGSAFAQSYNHLIMPLANARDQQTQVAWGIRDFERRFGRRPEGMWLPETAVNMEVLETLARNGLRFTVLAPHQARAVRKLGMHEWHEVTGARIDTRMPYVCRLPTGREIAVFFYDGPASRAVAFERLLDSGAAFVDRLLAVLPASPAQPALANIATDGESYGHHHRHGDMALAWALRALEGSSDAKLTNYGQFLEIAQLTHEVEIVDNTSWSCVHGVERWRADCGCNLGTPGWNQAWRGPLRETLDWLRDEMTPLYEREAAKLLRDPWAARDAYIDLVLDRSDTSVKAFFAAHGAYELRAAERSRALKLLELQRQALLMYTSCGWFFDEVSGIETIQVLAYAGRALQLSEELFGEPFEKRFVERLEKVPSNKPHHGNARRVYERYVRGAKVDLRWVAAHFAFSSLFEAYDDRASVYAYTVEREEGQSLATGRARLATGRVRVQSRVTGEDAAMSYAVVHLGDHNLHGGVRPFRGDEQYRQLVSQIGSAFQEARMADVLRLVGEHFGDGTYTIGQLFRDEQRKIVQEVLEETLQDFGSSFRRLYDRYLPLVRFLVEVGQPLPNEFRLVTEFVVNQRLRQAIDAAHLDLSEIERLLDEAQREHVQLDGAGLAYAFQKRLDRIMSSLRTSPTEVARVEEAASTTALARRLPFEINLWRAQNECYDVLRTTFASQLEHAKAGDAEASRWVERFRVLGADLNVFVPSE